MKLATAAKAIGDLRLRAATVFYRGAAVPSWETLQRLAEACGRHLRIDVEPIPATEDAELTELLLRLTPAERLQALSRYAHLHELARRAR